MDLDQIAVIGDCHASRLIKHNHLNTQDIRLKIWSKGGLSFSHNNEFSPYVLFEKNVMSSTIESPILDKPYNNTDNPDYSIKFSEIKNTGIVLFWMGYVDVKNFIFPNPEKDYYKILNNSILNIKKYFNNSKIMFIEPMPQFIPFISPKTEDWQEIDYKIRLKQNDIFLKNLKIITKKHDANILISQTEIMDCINKKEITEKDIVSLEVDALLENDYKKIYKLLISKLILFID
jgi:hypothetical protein